MIDISLPPHPLFQLGPIAITNTVFTAFLVTIIITILSLGIRFGMGLVPSRTQSFLEAIFEYLEEQMDVAFETRERARKFLPLILTLLIFIAVANQLSLVPLLFQIIFEGKPILRLSTSDLSQTLGLALLVVGFSHVLALVIAPREHIGNYIRIMPLLCARSLKDVANALLGVFLGFLDIVGELAKIMSLSARLFGNIFAGDVMIVVIMGLSKYTQFFVPIPFLFLGIVSGLIQAFVFTMLSIQFISGTVNAAFVNRQSRMTQRAAFAKVVTTAVSESGN